MGWDEARKPMYAELNISGGSEPLPYKFSKEVSLMPKDSQVDNKKARKQKSKGQTPLTQENQNQSNNTKKQSTKSNDV